MNYGNVEQENLRKNFSLKIFGTLEEVFKNPYLYDSEVIPKINDLITVINKIYDTKTPEEIQFILGGEINKDIAYIGNDPKESSVPLYFIIDLIILTMESKFENKIRLNKELVTMMQELKSLREKTSELEYNKVFNPNEKLSKYAVGDIIAAKGNFKIGMIQKEGIEHLAIRSTLITQNVSYRNGEYRIDAPDDYSDLGSKPLYEKDNEAIKKIETEKIKKKLEKINGVIGKYFKNGEIPTIHTFNECLLDDSLDSRIRTILYAISDIKTKNQFYFQGFVEEAILHVYDLEELELKIEKEIETKKTTEDKITQARERYSSKNFLWKYVHRKISPEKQNFDELSDQEIDSLYTRKVK